MQTNRSRAVATYHTHRPAGEEVFSGRTIYGGDIPYAWDQRKDAYLATPSGALAKLNWKTGREISRKVKIFTPKTMNEWMAWKFNQQNPPGFDE